MQASRANLADFVYFLAIARHRSFSRAGKEVGISAGGNSATTQKGDYVMAFALPEQSVQ
jgi:hypothetical protein